MVNSKIRILLKKQIKFVCDTEMKSLKPGNVHKFSEGHDMNVKDFFKSSLIISKCLTKKNLDLGKKILNSVNEIQNKIKKNTNLGIILMLSPIVTVVQKEGIISKEELLRKIRSLINEWFLLSEIKGKYFERYTFALSLPYIFFLIIDKSVSNLDSNFCLNSIGRTLLK